MASKESKAMKNNKGSVLASSIMLLGGMVLILTILGIALFEQITTGIFHEIKNDLYMINRNVLLSIRREYMGEDVYDFYEKEVEDLVEKEIKKLWNADVSINTEKGFVQKVDILESKIFNKKAELEINTILKLQLRPLIFKGIFKDNLVFTVREITKTSKMER